jgi:beta-glucosidase
MLAGPRGRGHDLPPGVLFTDDARERPYLRGEVFDNADFKGNPVAVRRDAQVDFRWDAAHPVRKIPTKGAHLRWTGLLVPKVDGSYTLSLTFVGAAQVFLDGKALISEAKPGDSGEVRLRSAVLDLEANHPYHLRIEYHPRDAIGLVQFGWLAPDDLDRALAAAKKADHIVLALGISPALEGEEMHFSADGFAGGDRTSILLPEVQRDLLSRVAALGKPFTVVLTNGSALSFDVSKPNAILESWYYGQGGGEAIAEALLGETNPSGHLPITFYKSDDDLPDFTDYRMAHRTYRYFDGTPLFPFGHGLSYTTFRYEKVDSTVADSQVTLTVKVHNTGKRAGDAVVQVYASALQPPVSMPREWLVGFARQHLEAGEDEDVSVVVPLDHLRRWDDTAHHFVIDSGSYQFRIGSSSADTPLTTDFQIQ